MRLYDDVRAKDRCARERRGVRRGLASLKRALCSARDAGVNRCGREREGRGAGARVRTHRAMAADVELLAYVERYEADKRVLGGGGGLRPGLGHRGASRGREPCMH